MEKRHFVMKITIGIFLMATLVSFTTIIFPFKINDSLLFGRLWGATCTILDGMVFYSLITKITWAKKCLIFAYLITLIMTFLISYNFKMTIFIALFWSIVYWTSIYFHNKESHN